MQQKLAKHAQNKLKETDKLETLHQVPAQTNTTTHSVMWLHQITYAAELVALAELDRGHHTSRSHEVGAASGLTQNSCGAS